MILSKNAESFKTLEERYKSINPPPIPIREKQIVPWRRYTITIVIAVPLLGATAYAPYHYFTKTKTSIQSVGNSVYILKRKDLLKQIKSYKNRIIILEGQGGAGKTTLAREYLKNIGKYVEYEINAETKGSVKSELAGLARALSKTKKDMESKSIIESISDENEKLRHLSIFLYSKLREQKD